MKQTHLFRVSPKQLGGFFVLALSFALYLITLSPTVNYWDCGEFIACANGLEVGHAPGAPLYLMLARVFSIFAGPQNVAYCINMLSAITSAATVWLLYSSLLIILNQIARNKNAQSSILSALIGSLTFAFTDSFWFSAVEAEVYAMSLFFTALTIWAILKWQTQLPDKQAHRWLLLIAFTMGLSIGIHLLNLLCLPVVIYWAYIKWKPTSRFKHASGLLLGIGILLVIQFFVVQNGLLLAKKIELLLVNTLHLPPHSGLLLFVISLTTLLVAAMAISYKRKPAAHFAFLALSMFILGLSSYAMVIIRANAQPGINLNSPTHVFSLESFINREQYGQRPLLRGPWFGANTKETAPTLNYRLNKDGQYEQYEQGSELIYNTNDISFLQRMYSAQKHHIQGYQYWTRLEGGEKPTLMHQLEFMFKYQLGHMYFRYFMWNFSGRQNHYQGNGDFLNGNFTTGIPIIDKHTLGNRQHLHAKELTSKARNHYFMLPLLFGLLGILLLVKRKKWDLLIFLSTLFFLTGIAIALYLNQPPFEPRERDYVFVGSFYAFAIFIGLGVWALFQKIAQWSPNRTSQWAAFTAVSMALPGLLLTNNFNDHDRSDRTLAHDLALSYLQSCAPNAILFTYGDNDTYPLWYLQEVEGIRQDISVINIGLLSADWYIEQQCIPQKNKTPLTFTIPLGRYKKGDLDYAAVIEKTSEPINLYQGLQFLGDTASDTRLMTRGAGELDFLPSKKLKFGDNSATIFKLHTSYLMKGQIALLDIIATNHGNRSIYFANGTPASAKLGLDDFIAPYGILGKLVLDNSEVKTQELYEVLYNKINLSVPQKSWYNETCTNAIHLSGLQQATISLANTLMAQADTMRAQQLLQKFYPIGNLPYYTSDANDTEWATTLFEANLTHQGMAHLEKTTYTTIQNLNFYANAQEFLGNSMLMYAKEEMEYLQKLRNIATKYQANELVQLIDASLRN